MVEKIDPDDRAVELVRKAMEALAGGDLDSLLPLLHGSLKTPDGADLNRNFRQFGFKKASGNVKYYAMPAEIHEVHKGAPSGGGRKDKYFVRKKPDVNGMPAPIPVFWPDDGGDPKIADLGSL